MLKNYLLIAWRNILRDKLYAFLSISGLAIGLAVFIGVLIYVNYEKSYDRWDSSLDQVYRLGVSETKEGEVSNRFWTPYSLGTEMMEQQAGVQTVSRIIMQGEQLVEIGDNRFYEAKVIAADSSFFDVFPYSFVWGNAQTALNKPRQVAISASLSEKYFGKANPVGQTLSIRLGNSVTVFTIAGVFRKTGPSHLNFDICQSYFNSDPNRWGRKIFQTYVKLKSGVQLSGLEKTAAHLFVEKEAAYQFSARIDDGEDLPAPGNDAAAWLRQHSDRQQTAIFFEPISNIHLQSRATGWRDESYNHPVYDARVNNAKYLYYFTLAAGLILLLAAINYTNFCVARASKRAKETGMRKVMGARRSQLISQFMTEAGIQTAIAFLLSLGICTWLLQVVNRQFVLDLHLWDAANLQASNTLFWQVPPILLSVTLLAGIYPAFILSSFQAASVLKGNINRIIKGKLLRHALLVVQFTISAAFMTILTVVTLQLRYMQHDPGFDGDQVLVLTPASNAILNSSKTSYRWPALKQQLMQIPGVEKTTATIFYPGQASMADQEAQFNGQTHSWFFDYVHYDYFETLGMKLSAGRSFSGQFGLDTVNAALINETAARQMGVPNPLGQRVNYMLRDYTIIGVVKDNLSAGYTRTVAPSIYIAGAQEGLLSGYDHILVKIKGGNALQLQQKIQDFWKTIEPEFPLRTKWLDEEFGRHMLQYKHFGVLTLFLAIISTLIALLGIYALSAFAAAQRTREMGIRKVFGASVWRITGLLSKDFAVLLMVSLLLAIPVAYMVSNKWLTDFAYRISLSWGIFLVSGLTVTVLALCTAGVQAVKTGRRNPVTNLRTE